MARRSVNGPPTKRQAQARAENFCLKAIGGLRMAFMKAGHHDFEALTRDLDAKFRGKLKEQK